MNDTGDPSQQKAFETGPKRYYPIHLEGLRIETVLDFAIYLKQSSLEYVLYRSANLPFRERDRKRLVDHQQKTLYIEFTDKKKYHVYIEKHLSSIMKDDDIPLQKRGKILYSSATNLVEEMLERPHLRENFKRSENIVRNTVEYVLNNPHAFKSLLSITSFDYYTYTHCVNVCAYGISLAKALKFDSQEELYDFGMGSLLHDVGKSKISRYILNKPGKLTDDEFRIMKCHPEFGLEIVQDSEDISAESLAIIHQHHEKMNGYGYPQGLKGDDIHPYARIAFIADVFDALTTDRSYRKALNTFPALRLIKDEMDGQYDFDSYRALVLLLKK
ncbi:MAG: HD-GYP domain-containing protein [Planctomycetota bacterium]|nr:MAG: HD-GYP domain-containing protein [Planctomycetota bacterium]